jgi:hypothetical protein
MPSWVRGKLAMRAELSAATQDNHRASKKEIRCEMGFGRTGAGAAPGSRSRRQAFFSFKSAST